MLAKVDPQITRAVGTLMELSDEEKRNMIEEYKEKQKQDEYARLEAALEEALEQRTREIVKAAHEMFLSIPDIMFLTNLSREKIETILE